MQDRYLYKAKRVDNGEWVTGFYSTQLNKHYIQTYTVLENGVIIFFATYFIIPETVCQCTGLRDKNGVLIWEGDIVRHGYTSYTGEFYNNLLVATSDNYGGWIIGECNRLTIKNVVKYSIEVIGDRFDNPELLEG